MKQQENLPPALRKGPDGNIEASSLADLLEWFLAFDQRVGLMRHLYIEELFQWKQEDEIANNISSYSFDNAESRFAIGCFQALGENNSKGLLQDWITDILNALQEAKQTNNQIAESYSLSQHEVSAVKEAAAIPSNTEKRIYLNCCWIEALCTAEARFLGWVYQELYGEPFQPSAPPLEA